MTLSWLFEDLYVSKPFDDDRRVENVFVGMTCTSLEGLNNGGPMLDLKMQMSERF